MNGSRACFEEFADVSKVLQALPSAIMAGVTSSLLSSLSLCSNITSMCTLTYLQALNSANKLSYLTNTDDYLIVHHLYK